MQTVMIYANSKNTEIRAKLKLRSTTRGANNRLDVESIVSFDKADGVSTPVIGISPQTKHAHQICTISVCDMPIAEAAVAAKLAASLA